MHGIVSLLDDDHYRMVEDVWAGLDEKLGLRGVYVTPYPHFSYHVADHYDLEQVERILQAFARATAPFDVTTTGLGIFTEGIQPVVYVNVARSPQLSQANAALWPLLEEASAGIIDYYHADRWVPHITLGFGDVTRENLRVLSAWDFNWQIRVDNIALLFNEADARQDMLKMRFPLAG
jgi:2'-5' RNA ligase